MPYMHACMRCEVVTHACVHEVVSYACMHEVRGSDTCSAVGLHEKSRTHVLVAPVQRWAKALYCHGAAWPWLPFCEGGVRHYICRGSDTKFAAVHAGVRRGSGPQARKCHPFSPQRVCAHGHSRGVVELSCRHMWLGRYCTSLDARPMTAGKCPAPGIPSVRCLRKNKCILTST